jgi:nitrogen fixation NifU-like protein
MNTELDELYKQVILDHNKNPKNFGILEQYSHHADGHNPLCGDQINLTLVIENGIITDIKFNGSGCAISKASASIMTTMVKGKTLEEAKLLFDDFHEIVTKDIEQDIDEVSLGKLAVFCGVREFPARIKCASLAWHTLNKAMNDQSENLKGE